MILSINITAKVAIVTKAKLDAISVNGSCSCDDLPPPPQPTLPVVDVMCVVDGSDSFNIKVNSLFWIENSLLHCTVKASFRLQIMELQLVQMLLKLLLKACKNTWCHNFNQLWEMLVWPTLVRLTQNDKMDKNVF